MKFQSAFTIKIYFIRVMSSKRTGFYSQNLFFGAVYYIIFYAIVSPF